MSPGFFFFKQKTAYEMRISDWSSDVCSSDLSISSMKMTVGATCRARANRRAICCSLSPYHLDKRSDDLTAMKFASDSRATALASKVLPVPGGPKKIGRASCRERVCQYG